MGSAILEAAIPPAGVDSVGEAQSLCEMYPLMPECLPEPTVIKASGCAISTSSAVDKIPKVLTLQ